jgi:hypothetical protein
MPAPRNNKNATKGAIAKAALKKALAIYAGEEPKETTETYQALIDIWTKQIEQAALDGNSKSAEMIIERLDGKPGQSIDQTISAGEGVSFNMSFVAQDKDK